MKSNYNRKQCAKATTLAQVVTRGKGKSTAREDPVKLFPFPNTAQTRGILFPVQVPADMKMEKLTMSIT